MSKNLEVKKRKSPKTFLEFKKNLFRFTHKT